MTKKKPSTPPPLQQPERLPLWRGMAERFGVANRIVPGAVFPVAEIEEALRCDRDCVEFGFQVSAWRKSLEWNGLALVADGEVFRILGAAENAAVMAAFQRRATAMMCRALILGVHTDTTALSEADRRRHEHETERAAVRLVLTQRHVAIPRRVRELLPEGDAAG